MDPRRVLIIALAGLAVPGCAVLRPAGPPGSAGDGVDAPGAEPVVSPAGAAPADPGPPLETAVDMGQARPYLEVVADEADPRPERGGDVRVGAVQRFAWSPGRVYPVRAAPLRVTTLTLGPGETLVSKAAGDTVRWQIGETTSGEGADRRAHVLIKPLQRGLDTNLVLATNRRVYLIDLASVGADAFDVAVAWDTDRVEAVRTAGADGSGNGRAPPPVVIPRGPLDARYRIEPRGRRARWTPAAVFNDGLRTFIALDPEVQIDEAPALFVLAPDGDAQMVNYRQSGGLFIVDRVFDRAELRLGDRRPQVVGIRRVGGAAR